MPKPATRIELPVESPEGNIRVSKDEKSGSGKSRQNILPFLLENTFLRFCARKSPLREDGTSLCDLMVAADEHVLLFFEAPGSGGREDGRDPEAAWETWRKRAVDAQTERARAAEEYMRNGGRALLDPEGMYSFSVAPGSGAPIHLFVAAEFEGAGGEKSPGEAAGEIRYRYSKNPRRRPFVLEFEGARPVHVIDRDGRAVFVELDTIFDFCSYMEEKERAAARHGAVEYVSEKDLLAEYADEGDDRGAELVIGPAGENLPLFRAAEGRWEDYVRSEGHSKLRDEVAPSYLWDELVARAFEREENEPEIYSAGPAREMSMEPRFSRLALVEAIARAKELFDPEAGIGVDVVASPLYEDRLYAFMQFPSPRSREAVEEFLARRREALESCCMEARENGEDITKVIGIAADPPGSSNPLPEDFVLLDFSPWSDEDIDAAVEANFGDEWPEEDRYPDGEEDDGDADGRGEEEFVPDLSKAYSERFLQCGHLHVAVEFWNRLGFDGALAAAGLDETGRRAVRAMAVNRLMGLEPPRPSYAADDGRDWIPISAAEDYLGRDLADIPAAVLEKNLRALREGLREVEAGLRKRERELYGLDDGVFLCDLVRAEFFDEPWLGPRERIVEVALAVDAHGFPVACSTGEKALETVFGKLLELADGIPTVVLAPGAAAAGGAESLRSLGIPRLAAASGTERNELLALAAGGGEFSDSALVETSRYGAPRKNPVEVSTMRAGGETLALFSGTPAAASRDRKKREREEEKFAAEAAKPLEREAGGEFSGPDEARRELSKIERRYPRVARYARAVRDPSSGRVSLEIDPDGRAAAERLDGSGVARTDRGDMGAERIWRTLDLLRWSDAAFRSARNPFPRKSFFPRVEISAGDHALLCVLARHLAAAVEKTLLDAGEREGWKTVREWLRGHGALTTVMPLGDGTERCMRASSVPGGRVGELYRLLGVDGEAFPGETWTRKEKPRENW